jgi:hypothetical protein
MDPSSVVLERSRLDTWTSLDLSGLKAELDKRLPRTFELVIDPNVPPAEPKEGEQAKAPALQAPAGVTVVAKAERGEIKLESAEDKILLSVELGYGVWTSYMQRRKEVISQCGCEEGQARCAGGVEQRRKALLVWEVTVGVKGVELVPVTSLKLDGVEACALGKGPDKKTLALGAPFLAHIKDGLNGDHTVIVESLKAVDKLKENSALIWEQLREEIPLGEGRPSLSLRPRAFTVGAPSVLGESLVVPLQFAIRPVIEENRKKRAVNELPAPSEELDAKGYQVAISSQIPNAEAVKPLLRDLKGKRYPQRGREFVRVEDVSLYGSQGKVIVALTLGGPVPGKVYVRGTLHLEAEEAMLSLEDVRFDDSSDQALDLLYHEFEHPDASIVRVPWFDREEILEQIRQSARWPLGQMAQDLKERLERAGKRPLGKSKQLNLELDEVSFANVAIGARAIHVLVTLSGKMEATEKERGASKEADEADK